MAYDEVDDSELEDDDSLDKTYLTFAVGGEEYAIPVAQVTEIVRLQKIFAVPDVARHVRGVINLRSKVIPLLDVRARFGLPEAAYDDRTVIVVIEVGGTPTGLVVDSVHDITELPPDSIEPSPSFTQASARPLVTGISKRAGRVGFVIDVERLIDSAPVSPPEAIATP